jgi:hypothetical protein
MTEEWTKVQSEIWNPEAGDEISGIYLGFQPEVGDNKSNLYKIETSEGKQLDIWGSKVLDGKMVSIKVGQQVKIKFMGKIKPPKGKEYKSYEIFTKPLVAQ